MHGLKVALTWMREFNDKSVQSALFFASTGNLDINQPLNKLGEQPQRTHASYTYDWLVALYTRGSENSSYQAPNNLSETHHQTLLKLLA